MIYFNKNSSSGLTRRLILLFCYNNTTEAQGLEYFGEGKGAVMFSTYSKGT